jgi:hypothetical protein
MLHLEDNPLLTLVGYKNKGIKPQPGRWKKYKEERKKERKRGKKKENKKKNKENKKRKKIKRERK